MIKVAYINSVSGFGSTGRIVSQLATMPDVQGKIYYGRKQNSSHADALKMNSFWGNASHAIQTYLFDRHGFCNKGQTERMILDLQSFQPDIVHLHNLHGYYLDVEPLFAYLKQSGIPVVWTLHDCWSFTGHCAHYMSIPCEKWKHECNNCPGIHKYPVSWTGKHVTENYHRKKEIFCSLGDQLTLVTPSKWLQDQVQQSFLKGTDTQVIPTGINLSVFKPVPSTFRIDSHYESKYLVLACASTWDNSKGLDTLIEIANQLPTDIQLVVVGLTQKQVRLFPKNVCCITRTESVSKLVELYSSADLFLNVTKEDTFPTVNIEALACGCPVMTTPVGGSPEMINDKTGVVLPDSNPQTILEALSKLSQQPNTFRKSDCISRAEQFSLPRMLENYKDLYQHVLEKKHCGKAVSK